MQQCSLVYLHQTCHVILKIEQSSQEYNTGYDKIHDDPCARRLVISRPRNKSHCHLEISPASEERKFPSAGNRLALDWRWIPVYDEIKRRRCLPIAKLGSRTSRITSPPYFLVTAQSGCNDTSRRIMSQFTCDFVEQQRNDSPINCHDLSGGETAVFLMCLRARNTWHSLTHRKLESPAASHKQRE